MELERWKKKKAKALKEGDLPQLIVCCKELADMHVFNENFDQALSQYQEMGRAAEAMNSELDVARANRLIGEIFCEMGEFDKAITHQRKHLDIARKQADRVEEQRALATLGRTYFMMSEIISDDDKMTVKPLQEAKKYFLDSLSLCDQLSDSLVGAKQRAEMRARLYLNLGLVHDDEGNAESAINFINQAVAICKKVDLWEDLFKAYVGLGCTYNKNGLKKEAISIFDKAINVAERLSTKIASLCEALSLKAEALVDLPDFRGARQTLLRAYKLQCPSVALRNEIEKKLRIVATMYEMEYKLTELAPEGHIDERKKYYEKLGDMAVEIRHYTVALTYYTLMLECVEKCGGDSKALIECYVSLAQTYKDDKNFKKAVEFFKKEAILEKDNYEESCKTYLNIAECYHLMKKNSNSIEAYKTARHCAEATKNAKLLKMVLLNLRQHYQETGNNQEASNIQREILSLNVVEFSDDDDDDAYDGLEKLEDDLGIDINLDELSDSDMDSDAAAAADKKAKRTRVRHKSIIQKKNELGETPLHRAAIAGNLTLVSKLLDQGHSVNVRDNSGWTPLHEAANHGHVEIVDLLLKNNAPVNDRGGSECNGMTPLLDAASCGHFDVMELLLQYKASPLMKNNDGMTVLDLMLEWKNNALKENGGFLESDISSQFGKMFSKLQLILERAGYNISQKRESQSKSNLDLLSLRTRKIVCDTNDDINVKMPGTQNSENCSSSLARNNRLGATNEYQAAMRALRFRNKNQEQSSLTRETKPPALIPASETVGDNWLEEDIVRPNKKRKTNEFLNERLRRMRSESPDGITISSEDVSSSATSPTPFENNITTSTDETASQEFSIETFPTSTQIDISSPSTSGTCSNRLKVKNLSRRNESPPSAPGLSKEKFVKIDSEVPVKMNYLSGPSSSVVCIRVLVEGKLLLVPVPSVNEHLDIEWLAVETAKRYKCLENVEPKLRLLTSDGAFLLNSDPVSLVLSMGELHGQVISWNLPSLVASYEKHCRRNDLIQDSSVNTILEACPSTSTADFSDIFLDHKHLSCALHALTLHNSLLTLDISGCTIPDSSMMELAENLSKFSSLQSLNLSNINMSSDGLTILSQGIVYHRGLRALKSLDMGFNPLGDCLTPLSTLINHLPSLTSLILPSGDLYIQSFPSNLDFKIDSLEILNLNYNEIGSEGLNAILSRLNPQTIQEIHLAQTGRKTIRDVGRFLRVNTPSTLRLLELSYCSATDNDMHDLIQGLEMCPRLEKLALEGVCDGVAQQNVDHLMTFKNVRSLKLSGSIDVQQPLQVAEYLASLAISSSCTEEHNWGQKGPFGYVASSQLRNTAKN